MFAIIKWDLFKPLAALSAINKFILEILGSGKEDFGYTNKRCCIAAKNSLQM